MSLWQDGLVRGLVSVVVGLVVAGCYDVHVTPGECAVHCGSAGCPSGFSCRNDGFCHAGSPDTPITLCPLTGAVDAAPADVVMPDVDLPDVMPPDVVQPDALPPVEGFPPCPDLLDEDAGPGPLVCARSWNGENSYTIDVAADSRGGAVVVGQFSGDLTIGDFTAHPVGYDDVWVVHFDNRLVPFDHTVISGDDMDEPDNVVVDPTTDTAYVTGHFYSSEIHLGDATAPDIHVPWPPAASTKFLAAIGPDISWIISISFSAQGRPLILPDGDLIVAGVFFEDATIGDTHIPGVPHEDPPGPGYAVIARLAKEDGHVKWHTEIQDARAFVTSQQSLVADPGVPGEAVFLGAFVGTVSLDGGASTVTSGGGGAFTDVFLLGFDVETGAPRWHDELSSDVADVQLGYFRAAYAAGGKVTFSIEDQQRNATIFDHSGQGFAARHTLGRSPIVMLSGDEPLLLMDRESGSWRIDSQVVELPETSLFTLIGLSPAMGGFAWLEDFEVDSGIGVIGGGTRAGSRVVLAGDFLGVLSRNDTMLLESGGGMRGFLMRIDR